MSRQINFSDLSDAQKEGYLKFIIENDIPLQQDDDPSHLEFVAKISIPAAIKQINSSYDSSEQSLDQVKIQPQKGKYQNTYNNKENDNQREQVSPCSQKNTELSQVAMKKNTNNLLNNCISKTEQSNDSRGISDQDFEPKNVSKSQNKQSVGKKTPFKSFTQKKEPSIQKFKGASDNIFSNKKGNKSPNSKNEISTQSNIIRTKQSSQDYSTNPQSSSVISTPDHNSQNLNIFPDSPLKQRQQQQHRQKQQSRTSHGNNILVVETDSHTESMNSTTEHSSNKPNMSDIYQILRSVGFSPKQLFLSETGEEDEDDKSKSSFSKQIKSNPEEKISMKIEEQRKNINNVSQTKQENKVDEMQHKSNDKLQSNKINSQRKSSFIPCQTETQNKKDQSRCQNLLSRFSNSSQNQRVVCTNTPKQKSVSPYSSKEQYINTPSPSLSRGCSPQKGSISPFKTIKKAVTDQNNLSTTTLKSKSSQKDNNNTSMSQAKGYLDKSPQKEVTKQVSKTQSEMSKSPLRDNSTNSKHAQTQGKMNSEQQQYPSQIVYSQPSFQDQSPKKMESKLDGLFLSVGYQKYPNISKLLKHKQGRISKMPIGQTKSIIEEIFISSSRTGSKRFKGQFREFVYEFFQCKFKNSTIIAESSLINFIASLEFHSETSPAAEQFLQIMEGNNESQLQFLIHAMQELQGYFKQRNLISVRITEKQLSKIFMLVLGETAKPYFDKQIKNFSKDKGFLEVIQQIEEFKAQNSISAYDFLAIFSQFRNQPELLSLNANCKDYETRRHSGQRFKMINESFGLVQECLSSRRETKQQQRGQQQQGIQQHSRNINQNYHSSHGITPSKESIDNCHSTTATTNTHSRQSSTLSSLSAVQNLFDQSDPCNNNSNCSRENTAMKETKQDFLRELNDEMDRMVHEFVMMFEIKSNSNMKRLQGLISKKCRLLLSALGSGEQKNKWFELLAISDPTYQQKMQAETTEKLFEAYQNSHIAQGKDQGNIRSLCRIILKVPELNEAISKLLICLLVPEE